MVRSMTGALQTDRRTSSTSSSSSSPAPAVRKEAFQCVDGTLPSWEGFFVVVQPYGAVTRPLYLHYQQLNTCSDAQLSNRVSLLLYVNNVVFHTWTESRGPRHAYAFFFFFASILLLAHSSIGLVAALLRQSKHRAASISWSRAHATLLVLIYLSSLGYQAHCSSLIVWNDTTYKHRCINMNAEISYYAHRCIYKHCFTWPFYDFRSRKHTHSIYTLQDPLKLQLPPGARVKYFPNTQTKPTFYFVSCCYLCH